MRYPAKREPEVEFESGLGQVLKGLVEIGLVFSYFAVFFFVLFRSGLVGF